MHCPHPSQPAQLQIQSPPPVSLPDRLHAAHLDLLGRERAAVVQRLQPAYVDLAAHQLAHAGAAHNNNNNYSLYLNQQADF